MYDQAWQRACADCRHMTPEEEEERNKRIADIKKHKDEMSKLRKEFEEMDDEVTSMVKEINEMKNRQSSASVEKIYNEMVKTYTENEKKKAKQVAERKITLAELEEDSDDDSLLFPIISKSKTVPTPDISSKLRKSLSDNLHYWACHATNTWEHHQFIHACARPTLRSR